MNQYNPGGGGGSNAGAGGQGGSGWDGGAGNPATYPTGGYGGSAFASGTLQHLIAGGGGGAGCSNNSTAATEYICSGGAGGGIIIIRAKSYSGSGSVQANGAAANDVTTAVVPGVTDAAGGGGAGGTIVLITNQSGAVGANTITASATGGKGGDMTTYFAHGPGGGGGGGYVITNVVPAGSVTVTGGVHGLTRTGSTGGPINNIYGSTSGSNGAAAIITNYSTFTNPNNVASPCGFLPVTLQSFNGVYRSGAVYLNWQTDAGVDFSYFVVERSTNGADFTALRQVMAIPPGGMLVFNYAYTDVSPLKGQDYYRLKMVDNDGRYRYSSIISIANAIQGFSVHASPNPFTGNVAVTITGNTAETVSLVLVNSEGKTIGKKTANISPGVNTQYFSNLQSLPAGAYFISIYHNNTMDMIKILRQ
jgi:hypothetical protein